MKIKEPEESEDEAKAGMFGKMKKVINKKIMKEEELYMKSMMELDLASNMVEVEQVR